MSQHSNDLKGGQRHPSGQKTLCTVNKSEQSNPTVSLAS